ncbi:hypothetical protein ACQ4M4_15180 [Leptolyngbya sp. AN02str]|jgi:hypothetical protein|uniref:Uncharacterized protein n=1 Tax=Leptolyngbya sp. NK1-12 TaxID=2547451 RepID=A0AA97ALY0_9CYAN|nr:hypothetical protein [Leptolyngbya sp. NK1-12]WNZ28081.1 hypothetical protein HJG54_34820 [Leptolyngbya sp. NK1-12]
MALFTLADLHQVHQRQQPLLGLRTHESEFALDRADPANFQLLMKQLFLGLPVQPLLDTHPLMARWVTEAQELVPELFQGRKKLWIDAPMIAPLTTGDTPIFIQVQVNYGLRRGMPRLYEWAICSAKPTWQDAVKLWVMSVHYTIPPEKLSLVGLALHPSLPAQKLRLQWDQTQQDQTQQWLMQLLTQPTKLPMPEIHTNTDYSLLLNLDAIPEVPL